jgi:hypothetical protein
VPAPGRRSWPRLVIVRVVPVAGLCAGTAVGALGAVAAPGTTAGGMFCAALMGLATGLRVREIAAGDRAARVSAGRRAGLVVGCVLAVGWAVVTGAALLLGLAMTGMLLVLAFAAGGAALWPRRSRPATGLLLRIAQPAVPPAADPSPHPAALPAFAPSPAGLSTEQLCRAWQHSYFALLDLPADAARTDVVRLREQLLDEIERRDPVGFARWIDTDARPGNNPGRYVVGEG